MRRIISDPSGRGTLTIENVVYEVFYDLKTVTYAGVTKTTGTVRGLPTRFAANPPTDPELPLVLKSGDTVRVAIFGGDPCKIVVNSPMPSAD